MSSYDDFEARLAKHPQLYQRFAELLDIAEAESGHLENADDAEDQIVDSLRHLGRELLEGWAQHKESLVSAQSQQRTDWRRDKKNSAGTVVSVQSAFGSSAIE